MPINGIEFVLERGYSIYINTEIEKVIFNPPATIVIWKNGDKTVVKCSSDDTYDKFTGLLLCIAKYSFGNTGKYNRILDKWCPEEQPEDKKVIENNADNEYTIFHDNSVIENLKDVIRKLTDESLIKAYAELNTWRLPNYFADVIALPTYVYDNFRSLPTAVRNKSITPIMNLVKDEIVRRKYGEYLDTLTAFEVDSIERMYTWEDCKDEHINLE